MKLDVFSSTLTIKGINMHIMVINCGSSSLKFQLILLPEEKVIAKGQVERIGQDVGAQFNFETQEKKFPKIAIKAENHINAVNYAINALVEGETAVLNSKNEIKGFGHRVVHGGEKFTAPVIINDEVIKSIEECNKLAPLHNPAKLEGIHACMKALPEVPNVAVFDTAFHQTMPPKAFHYALPYELYEKDHIRKYGFHGTSHKYVTKTFAALINKPLEEVNVVTVHLGNGSSLACVKNGKSVDTSMGLTPLPGVIMGTRSGDIDPALILYLMKKKGLTPDEADTLLNKKSGLLGFTGIGSDMRDIEAAAEEGNKLAILVLEMWAYSIAKYINAYVGILPKTDAVIFTAGIGENASELREIICENCQGIGIKLSEDNHKFRGTAGCISAADSRVPVYAIPTNEELQIAQGTSELLMK